MPAVATAGTTVVIEPTSGISTNWPSYAASSANWVSMPNSQGYGTAVSWPRDNFTKLSEMTFVPDPTDPNQASFKWEMIDGQRWITNARENAGLAGISSSEISNRIDMFPKTASYVFAMYSPELAELVIEIQKIEKTPRGTLAVYRGDYTPWHGEFHKWKRDYLTASEKSDVSKLGNNPFENFKGSSKTDYVFHNIEWTGVGVAVGHAMRYADAHVGFITSDKTRFEQRIKKSGGMLKKKVKVYIDGYAKPQWFVATPIEVQPDGGFASICVKNIGSKTGNGNTSQCDDPAHMAQSGVSIVEWAGGNMPETEEKLYAYIYKKSSFTVLAFTILTFAVTWGLASALSTVVGSGLGTGLSAASTAAIGAGVYAGVAVLQGAGVTSAQAGYLGDTGNGVLKPNSAAWDRHQTGLNQGLRNKQILSREGTGLKGVQSLYRGNCPEANTTAQCKTAGLNPGTMHRPDSYRDSNITLELRSGEAECIAKGFTGVALAKCASPKPGEWTVGNTQ